VIYRTLNDPTPGFNVTPFIDAEYLRNDTRYRQFQWNANTDSHALLTSVISNDLE